MSKRTLYHELKESIEEIIDDETPEEVYTHIRTILEVVDEFNRENKEEEK